MAGLKLINKFYIAAQQTFLPCLLALLLFMLCLQTGKLALEVKLLRTSTLKDLDKARSLFLQELNYNFSHGCHQGATMTLGNDENYMQKCDDLRQERQDYFYDQLKQLGN